MYYVFSSAIVTAAVAHLDVVLSACLPFRFQVSGDLFLDFCFVMSSVRFCFQDSSDLFLIM